MTRNPNDGFFVSLDRKLRIVLKVRIIFPKMNQDLNNSIKLSDLHFKLKKFNN